MREQIELTSCMLNCTDKNNYVRTRARTRDAFHDTGPDGDALTDKALRSFNLTRLDN